MGTCLCKHKTEFAKFPHQARHYHVFDHVNETVTEFPDWFSVFPDNIDSNAFVVFILLFLSFHAIFSA